MFISLNIFDAALERIVQSAEVQYVCSHEPTAFSELADFALAGISIDASNFMGPLDGCVDCEVLSRMIVVLATTGVGNRDGTVSHVALASESELLFVVSGGSAEEITAGQPFVVRDWCIVAEYVEGGCEIPEGYLD